MARLLWRKSESSGQEIYDETFSVVSPLLPRNPAVGSHPWEEVVVRRIPRRRVGIVLGTIMGSRSEASRLINKLGKFEPVWPWDDFSMWSKLSSRPIPHSQTPLPKRKAAKRQRSLFLPALSPLGFPDFKGLFLPSSPQSVGREWLRGGGKARNPAWKGWKRSHPFLYFFFWKGTHVCILRESKEAVTEFHLIPLKGCWVILKRTRPIGSKVFFLSLSFIELLKQPFLA